MDLQRVRNIPKRISKIFSAVQKVRDNAALILRKDHILPWDLIRYTADVRKCNRLYGASIADYFELRF